MLIRIINLFVKKSDGVEVFGRMFMKDSTGVWRELETIKSLLGK